KKRFVGVWHGFSESQLEFARLELYENGTGLLAISFLPDSPPDKYFVTQWSLKDFRLALVTEAAEPKAEAVSLENITLGLESLRLTLRPLHGGDWSRKMTLLNETAFHKRAEAARETLESLQKHH